MCVDRDDAAERERVADLPARADHVGGDDRLPVAGCERVRRAPEERQGEGEDDQPGREVVAADQRLEAVRAVLRGRTGAERRWDACSATWLDRRIGGGRVGRVAQEVPGVRAELVADAPIGRGGGDEPRAAGGVDDDLLPAQALRVVPVTELECASARAGVVDGVEAECLQACRAGPQRDLRVERAHRGSTAVDDDAQPPAELGGDSRPAEAGALLERRDLREVEEYST